jgi:hypothetical protein
MSVGHVATVTQRSLPDVLKHLAQTACFHRMGSLAAAACLLQMMFREADDFIQIYC